MKKPNITEGPWQADGRWVGVKSDSSLDDFARIFGNESQAEANAQAISAVPDMIDALIEARWYMRICREQFIDEELFESAKFTDKKIAEIEEALTKAGITINETGDE